MRALVLILALSACVNEPGTIADVHTGVTGTHSRMYPAASTLLSNLNASALVATKNGETRYTLGLQYTATGVGWAGFKRAFSFGQEYPYVVTRARVLGCGGGCTIIEEGLIRMTAAQFKRAAVQGFEFKLVGSDADVIGRVPAEAFREALAK